MPYVRLSTRLPRIEAGPLATPGSVAHDDDWGEIEAILAAPAPSRGRRTASRGVGRGIAGLAALIAAGGLALAGWSALQRVCVGGCGLSRPAAEMAAMPSKTMAVPPRARLAIGSQRHDDITIAEGRSVVTGVAAAPRNPTPPDAATSIAPAKGGAAADGSAADHRGGHRHKHRDSHTEPSDRHARR